MVKKTQSKKNARQVLAVQKKIEKTRDALKGLQDKLEELQKAQGADEPKAEG